MNTTKWDILAGQVFDSTVANGLHPSAMDNIMIAHPEIHKLINSHFVGTRNLSVLDFGCGTGSFIEEICPTVDNILGIDPSAKMIEIAQKRDTSNAKYIVGDINDISESQFFDLIVSVMVFQFIEHPEPVIEKLCMHLNKNGLLVIVVHHEVYIDECIRRQFKFHELENQLHICLNNISIPIYKRKESQYDNMIIQSDMIKHESSEPKFSDNYIKLYAKDGLEPLHVSKYLIMSCIKL